MIGSTPRQTGALGLLEKPRRWLPILIADRRKLKRLRWLIPAGLMLVVVAYELGPSRWIYEGFGFTYHLAAEIVIFGTVGPILAFIMLELLGRWKDEKETADLQAQLIAQANEKEVGVREIGDDTIQVLFATSLLLTTFKFKQSDLPAETVAQIEVTEQSLTDAIERLRSHLLT